MSHRQTIKFCFVSHCRTGGNQGILHRLLKKVPLYACFSGEKRGVDRHQVYVWVYSATHPAETDICLASRCDTPRRNGYVFGFIVRHTPAFGHPSPRGVPHSGGVCRTIKHRQSRVCRTIKHRQSRVCRIVRYPYSQAVSHCQISHPLNPVNPWLIV